jgi:hypothetical protein
MKTAAGFPLFCMCFAGASFMPLAAMTLDEAGAALGNEFDGQLFDRAYAHFNTSTFHQFTSDNQDYLAYICLAISSGYCTLNGRIAPPPISEAGFPTHSV